MRGRLSAAIAWEVGLQLHQGALLRICTTGSLHKDVRSISALFSEGCRGHSVLPLCGSKEWSKDSFSCTRACRSSKRKIAGLLFHCHNIGPKLQQCLLLKSQAESLVYAVLTLCV